MEKTIRKTREIVIKQMLDNVNIPSGSLILEPSAGTGDLVDGIINTYSFKSNGRIYPRKFTIHCVELNKESRESLIKQGFTVIGSDFLQLKPNPIYDFVIACPTYKDNVDVEHIMHMYEFLKPDGKIISLTHPAWTTGSKPNQAKFRSWLSNKVYSMKMLEDFSFVEDYKTQPSMVITIKK